MQSASATLAAAIVSALRRPVARVRADWAKDGNFTGTYDDLTPVVASVSVERSITSDLPDEANLVVGSAAAQATVEMSGNFTNGNGATQVLSPYGSALGGGVQRVGAPLEIDLGMVGDAGAEVLPAFRGRARSSTPSSGDRTVSLTGLDGSELLRTSVTLPVFVALDPINPQGAPALDGGWVMDYILRRNGYYRSPAQRASAVLSATMFGSAYPEVGTLVQAGSHIAGVSYQGTPTFRTITHGRALKSCRTTPGASTVDTFATWTLSSNLSVNNGSNFFIECDRVNEVTPTAGAGLTLIQVTDSLGTTGVALDVTTGGLLQCRVLRGGATGAVTLGTMPSGTDTYLAVHFAMTAAGANINTRIGSTTTSGSATVGTSTGNPAVTQAQLFIRAGGVVIDATVGGLQVTSEAFSAGMWNNAFTPTATLDDSLSPLQAMPVVEDGPPWGVLQDLAKAECGVILFREDGTVRFLNRAALSGGSSVATLSSSRALKSLAASEDIDGIRNIVHVPAAPLDLDVAQSAIWSVNDSLVISALGSILIGASFDGAAFTLDDTIAYYSGSTAPSVSGSGYRAARNSDGTGGDISNLGWTVVRFPGRALLTVTNPNAFDAWLVDNSLGGGSAGQPLLQLAGRVARPTENGYMAVEKDATSITANGEQTLDVPENVWRQTSEAANTLAVALKAQLKDAHPVLTGVEVVADPRLQLADRVTVTDPAGLLVSADFWIVAKTDRLDSGGMSQSLTLRQV